MEYSRPENRLVELAGLDVLVVDDDPDALDLIATLLETRHAHVMCASSAGEAFACMEEKKPDVLVSDIGMPGEDGYSLMHRVRELEAKRGGSTPAIALTAFNQESDRLRALAAGFSLHLPKPVDVAVLCSEIERLGRAARGSAIELLRRETRNLHDKLEDSAYARGVLEGTVTLPEYGDFLSAMHLLHRELEQAVDETREPAVRAVFQEDMRKSPLIALDLSELGRELTPRDQLLVPAERLAGRFATAAEADAFYLLGAMYVLEGSSLGGRVQRAALLARPEFAKLGHRYLAGYESDTRGHFERFVARLNRALEDDAQRPSAIEGARQTFETMGEILRALSQTHPIIEGQDGSTSCPVPCGSEAC